MSRVKDIISRARAALGDGNATRWSDSHLLKLLSEAQQDMSARCLLLKKVVDYPIVDGQATYRLPRDFIKLEYGWASDTSGEKKHLEVVHYKDVERQQTRHSIGDLPTQLIIGFESAQEVRINPMPNEVQKTYVNSFDGSKFGRLTFIGDKKGNGIEAGFSQGDDHGKFGVAGELSMPASSFSLLYYYKPAPLETMDDELAVKDTCDLGLRYYIIATALLEDMDGRNINASAQFQNLYALELKRNMFDRETTHTQDSPEYMTIPFRTGFER